MIKSNVKHMIVAAGLAAGGLVTQAEGHHSLSSFDRDNPVTLGGTVKEFKYMNPHTWIYLMVPDGNGGETQWNLEGATVSTVLRLGWTSKTLLPGMRVKLLVAPRKDGAVGGEWLRLLEVNGQPYRATGK